MNIKSKTIFQNSRIGKQGCLFCDPIDGMQIHKTDNFQVLIDTFPIVPGHMMISSLAHFGSAGEIPKPMQEELQDLKNQLSYNARSFSGCHVFYEHGRAGSCMKTNPNTSKCEHFHLHCLPVDISITQKLQEKFDCIKMTTYDNIASLFLEHGSYLYFEENDGSMYFFPAEDQTVESHLLRTLLCEALGISNRQDWENYTDYTLFMTSFELINACIHFYEEAKIV